MPNESIVFLFDIDGTLVRAAPTSESAIVLTCAEVFGISDLPKVELGGRTDRAIFGELFEKLGIEFVPAYTAFEQVYYRHLSTIWNQGGFVKMPGVDLLLQSIQKMENCHLGLLSGNSEFAARIKLEAADLWHHFAFGEFGREEVCRNQLARKARTKAEQTISKTSNHVRLVVIGDTPADIACAREINAVAIAVGTGPFKVSQLMKFNPDFIYENFCEIDQVIADFSRLRLY